MKRIAAAVGVVLALAGSVGSGVAQAQDAAGSSVSTMSTTTAMSPEVQRILMALATTVLTSFASGAASGSLEGFDPGPAIERAIKNAIASRDVNAALDRLVDQAGSGADGASLPPEMRALLKAALAGAVAMARSEVAREFGGAR